MKVDVRFSSEVMQDDELFSRAVRGLSEVAIMVNRAHIRRMKKLGRPVPDIYTPGLVKWQDEPEGLPDQLVDIPTIIQRGHGDCFHLASWYAAQEREKGRNVTVRVTRQRLPGNKRLFHVLDRVSGREECPSKKLGM